MSITDILEIANANKGFIAIIFVILLTGIEISPLKINPWGALKRGITNFFLSDVINSIETLDKKLDEHIIESNERDLRLRRESILNFASDIGTGKQFHKEQYEQMLRECDEYLEFCISKKFKNAVAEESIDLIRDEYRERLETNDFLQYERRNKNET